MTDVTCLTACAGLRQRASAGSSPSAISPLSFVCRKAITACSCSGSPDLLAARAAATASLRAAAATAGSWEDSLAQIGVTTELQGINSTNSTGDGGGGVQAEIHFGAAFLMQYVWMAAGSVRIVWREIGAREWPARGKPCLLLATPLATPLKACPADTRMCVCHVD
jgi:hypothetical protein